MPEYVDMRWHGPAEAMEAALAALPVPEGQVGPILLDEVAYVLRREHVLRPVPEELTETGPQLSRLILGVFA
jgi:uncharacterized protein YbjT (DUF2867 family)